MAVTGLRIAIGRPIVTALQCAGLTLAIIVPARGQVASGEPVAAAAASFAGYDVVSVKPNVTGSGSTGVTMRDTVFQATNVSIKLMLTDAYGIRNGLIFGLPKWAESTRWDINAKLLDAPPEDPPKLSGEQSTALYRTKVKSILIDRFHLTAHTETKILPTYDLVLLPGPTLLKQSQLPEDKHGNMSTHNQEMTATGIPLKSPAHYLSELAGRTVTDKTGLIGDYDLSLKWSPDELAEAAKDTGTNDRPPGIFTALQEQLGLKLVPGKGPSQTLVVDTISSPATD